MIVKFFDKIIMTPWPFWKKLWKFQSKLNSSFIPIFALIVFSIIISGCYAIINHFAEWRDFSILDISTIIDDNIPFIRSSIIIYGLYYLLFPLMVLAAPQTKKGSIECIFAFQIIFTFTVVTFIIFLLFPIEITTRENIDIGSGLIASFYNTLHLADPPYNTFPSLHVNHSVLLSWIFLYWIQSSEGFLKIGEKLKKIISPLIWMIAILIIISTLTTKQHFVLDVPSAIFLAVCGIYYMKKCITHVENNENEIINYLEN